MPRRAKTSRKKRTRVRRALKRGRRKYKSSFRRRKYHVRRLYRRRKFRRRTSRAYRMSKKVGLKYTLNLSLLDFLLFPYYDLRQLIANQIARNMDNTKPPIFLHDNNSYPGDNDMNSNNANMLRSYFNSLLDILSTELMDNTRMYDFTETNRKLQRENLFFRAFNPPLSHKLLGSMFNTYLGMFRSFKFVGVKVKWIPTSSRFTTSVPITRSIISGSLSVPSYQMQSYSGSVNGYVNMPEHDEPINMLTTTTPYGDPESLKSDLAPSIYATTAGMYDAFTKAQSVTAPQYRLWVCFDKDNYEDAPFRFYPVSATEDQWNAIYDSDEWAAQYSYRSYSGFNAGYLPSRFKVKSYYDQSRGDEDSVLVNTKNVRSFSLLRPFKFFVRPYCISKSEEYSEGAPMNKQISRSINQYAKNYTVPDGDKIVHSMRRMGYQLTPHFYPELYWLPTHPQFSTQANVTAFDNNVTKLIMNFNDNNFFNPVLFSYLITRDDISIDAHDNSCFIKTVAPEGGATYQNNNYKSLCYRYSDFSEPANFANLGRFKVTFYVRFKNRKSFNQLVALPLDTPYQGEGQQTEYPVPYDTAQYLDNAYHNQDVEQF